MDTTTARRGAPLDDRGRLLHLDDPAAQLALAIARLEEALRSNGHEPADLASVRVLTTDRSALEDVLDVLLERFGVTGARPEVEVDEQPGLGVPGMFVALEARVHPPDRLREEHLTHEEPR